MGENCRWIDNYCSALLCCADWRATCAIREELQTFASAEAFISPQVGLAGAASAANVRRQWIEPRLVHLPDPLPQPVK